MSTRSQTEKPRRSKRLNPHLVSKAPRAKCYVEITTTPKRRKAEPQEESSANTSCQDKKKCHPARTVAASNTIVEPATKLRSLEQREKELAEREMIIMLKSQDMESRLASVCLKEQELDIALRHKEALAAYDRLEEHLTCPLCYEFLACPFSLNIGLNACGHSFCATCILKWFFSKLHDACGGWHESVHCPICRSLLVLTPDRVPRSERSFPFVRNRTISGVLQDQIDCLLLQGVCQRTIPATEKEEVLALWKDGGPLRIEWFRRESEGKREMEQLAENWTKMKAADFLDVKKRLDV